MHWEEQAYLTGDEDVPDAVTLEDEDEVVDEGSEKGRWGRGIWPDDSRCRHRKGDGTPLSCLWWCWMNVPMEHSLRVLVGPCLCVVE